MGLIDDLESITDEQPAKRKLDGILEELDDKAREALLATLADKSKPSTRIAAALTANGHTIGDGALHNWRKAHGFA